MLQQFEYNPNKFIRWFLGHPNLFSAKKRGKLELTNRAKLMLALAYAVWALVVGCGAVLALLQSQWSLLIICLAAPFVSAFGVFTASGLLQALVVSLAQNKQIKAAKAKLQSSKAIRIAVMGSYGKTTMKELLGTVLSQGKKVAATPGNKNVLISHARWVLNDLRGDEEVLIFEYGEGKPGDIAELADFSQPNIAVITGLAPAHLDEYPSLEAIADDFASIQKIVSPKDIFVHATSELLRQKAAGAYYDDQGIAGLKVSDIKIDFTGTSFTLAKDDKKLRLKTGLLGKHQIGPLVAVVAIAQTLGLTDEQIVSGIAVTKPYEHRMQARHVHGAWIVDDTYNGNIEGMRAGLELLKTLSGKNKIYVTPGLVDQGIENETVHKELGRLIAAANPDKTVLMQNSNTAHIRAGLEANNYSGELVIETNPLEYYTNLEHFLAAGDVILLQNDLPDSYI